MAHNDGTHYEVLGVARSASVTEIKQAYRAKVKDLHPDMQPGTATDAETLVQLHEAYGVLSHPDRRNQYDESLDQAPVADLGPLAGRRPIGLGLAATGVAVVAILSFGSYPHVRGPLGAPDRVEDAAVESPEDRAARAEAIRRMLRPPYFDPTSNPVGSGMVTESSEDPPAATSPVTRSVETEVAETLEAPKVAASNVSDASVGDHEDLTGRPTAAVGEADGQFMRGEQQAHSEFRDFNRGSPTAKNAGSSIGRETLVGSVEQPPQSTSANGTAIAGEERIAAFVQERYLASIEDKEVLITLYCDPLTFYDDKLSRSAAIARINAYQKRWPRRSYLLRPETLQIEQSENRPDISVAFEFDYQVSRDGRSASGIGKATLTLRPNGESLQICAEDSIVIRRNTSSRSDETSSEPESQTKTSAKAKADCQIASWARPARLPWCTAE